MVELQSSEQIVNLIDNMRYTSVQVESISIPHIWYYLPKDTVVTFVDSLGATHTFTLAKGSPNITEILTFIIGRLNALETGANVYAYTINNTTLTWTISSTLNWAINFTAVPAQHLGLTVTTPYGGWGLPPATANSLTSSRFFMTSQQVVINAGIGAKGQSISYDNLSQEKSNPISTLTPSNYLVSWPIVTSFGQVETYYLGDFGLIFDLASGYQTLNFRITDEFGNLLDFSPQRAYVNLVYTSKNPGSC
jgi:hypothetical protein